MSIAVRKDTARKSGVPGWLIPVIVIVGVLVIAGSVTAWLVVPAAMERARVAAQRAEQGSNLRQVMIGLISYAADHDNRYPPDLGTLVAAGFIVPDAVLAPGQTAPPPPTSDPTALKAWVNENTHVVYLYDTTLTVNSPAHRVVLHGPLGADGACIAYADARVVWKTRPEAEQIINDAEAALRSE